MELPIAVEKYKLNWTAHVEIKYDAIVIIKRTLTDIREEGKWQELGLITDQLLVSEKAVVGRS